MSSSAALPGVVKRPARLARRTHVFVPLLRKELRESRAPILVGLIVFWLVPAIWQALYAVVDPAHEVLPGFPAILLLVAGWLFAVVIGATTVCRDWGRSQEHFLLSRPVSPRAAIGAKLLSGAIVILVVSSMAALWDLGVWRVSFALSHVTPRIDDYIDLLAVAVPVACGLAIAYMLAFSLAVVTRQTLSSILIASLVLAMWATAPLVSTRFEFLHPTWLIERSVGRRLPPHLPAAEWGINGPSFIMSVAVCLALSIILAFWAAARERVIRLGHKPLAWAVGLVTVLLFSAAMMEVGNSLVVRDQKAVGALGSSVSRWSFAARDGRYVAMDWRVGTVESPVFSFRVEPSGRIRDVRQSMIQTSEVLPVFRHLVDYTLDTSARTVVTAICSGPTTEFLRRAWLSWEEGDTSPRLVSTSELSPPPDPAGRQRVLVECAVTDTHAFLVYAFVPEIRPREEIARPRAWERSFCIFEWPRERQVSPRLVFGPAPWRHTIEIWTQAPGGTATQALDVATGHAGGRIPQSLRPPVGLAWSVAQFRANWSENVPNDPTALLDHWYVTHDMAPLLRQSLAAFLDRTGVTLRGWDRLAIVYDGAKNLAYATGRGGLSVSRYKPPGDWELVGQYRASALSMVVRGDTWGLARLGDSLLVEQTRCALVVYDVSDPARPRRVGFFNTASPESVAALQVITAEECLVLMEGSLLSVLELPAR